MTTEGDRGEYRGGHHISEWVRIAEDAQTKLIEIRKWAYGVWPTDEGRDSWEEPAYYAGTAAAQSHVQDLLEPSDS